MHLGIILSNFFSLLHESAVDEEGQIRLRR